MLTKCPGDSVIFSFPPVDDLFGKMAVSRHVPCSIQNYGEIENPAYVFCLLHFLQASGGARFTRVRLLLVAIHSTTYW